MTLIEALRSAPDSVLFLTEMIWTVLFWGSVTTSGVSDEALDEVDGAAIGFVG